jgi:hypothetical protein
VSLIQYAPLLWWKIYGVFETLKDDKTVLRAITMPSERGKGEGVCGVVREVEPAVETERLKLRVLETCVSRAHQTVHFRLGWFLHLELSNPNKAIESL